VVVKWIDCPTDEPPLTRLLFLSTVQCKAVGDGLHNYIIEISSEVKSMGFSPYLEKLERGCSIRDQFSQLIFQSFVVDGFCPK
jgi:hypothetical protein